MPTNISVLFNLIKLINLINLIKLNVIHKLDTYLILNEYN